MRSVYYDYSFPSPEDLPDRGIEPASLKHLSPALPRSCLPLVPPWGKKKEGNGNPLQHSCLENPMDRGAGGPQFTGSQRVEHD